MSATTKQLPSTQFPTLTGFPKPVPINHLHQHLQAALTKINDEGSAQAAKRRSLKVISKSIPSRSYQYSVKPQITLRGDWLQQAGFNINNNVSIYSINGIIVICPEKQPCK